MRSSILPRASFATIARATVLLCCAAGACVHDLNRTWDRGHDAPADSGADLRPDAQRPDAPLPCSSLDGCPTGTHCCSGLCSSAPCVTTLAGSGLLGAADAPLTSALVNGVNGMLVDGQSNLLFTELYTVGSGVRLLNNGKTPIGPVPPGSIGRIAGGRFGCKPGPAREAELRGAIGLARDPDGNVYIADRHCGVIWKLSADYATVTIFAGAREELRVADGPSSQARFHSLQGLAYANGSLFASEIDAHVIRRISVPSGDVTTIAGNGQAGTVDGSKLVARLNAPAGLAVTAAGDLVFGQWIGGAIRQITGPATASPIVSTRYAGLPGEYAAHATLTILPSGPVLFHTWGVGLRQLTTANLVTTLTPFHSRIGEAYDPTVPGWVWLGGWVSGPPTVAANTISRLDIAAKAATAVAGKPGILGVADGPGRDASFATMSGGGIAVAADGKVWVADSAGLRVRQIDREGRVTSFGNGEWTDRAGTAATAALLFPAAITARGNDIFAVGRVGGYRVTKIDAKGTVSQAGTSCMSATSCARASAWGGLVADEAGNLYLSVAQHHDTATGAVKPYPAIVKITSPAGTSATSLYAGSGAAGCADGNPGSFTEPYGLARGADGVLYVADGTCGVRQVALDKTVTTISAGRALGVALKSPTSKTLYVSRGDNTLEAIDLETHAATPLAGDAKSDRDDHFRDGDLKSARFWVPAGLASDGKGAIYVLDAYNHRIRVVYP